MQKNKVDLKNEMIASAVLWWTEKLGGPPQIMDGTKEDGFTAVLSMFLSGTTGSNDTNSEAQKKFAQELQKHLEQEFSKSHVNWTSLSTDYGPEYPLSDICRKAGVSGARFPGKTHMRIDLNEGTVTWSTVHGSDDQIYPKI